MLIECLAQMEADDCIYKILHRKILVIYTTYALLSVINTVYEGCEFCILYVYMNHNIVVIY